MSRLLPRTLPRALRRPAGRTYASHAHGPEPEIRLVMTDKTPETSAFLQERAEVKHHAEQTTRLWFRISYFVCIPAILAGTYWVYRVESAHEAHLEHIREEHGGELPEKPEFDYLNIRKKPFPWGYNTLFYNPHTQKDMEPKSE